MECEDCSTVYGIFLKTLSIIKLQAFMAKVDKKHHVDVYIQIGDKGKEFTFADFLKRLGME